MIKILAPTAIITFLILTSFGFTEGMDNSPILEVPQSSPSSYMYIYCKRAKQNQYCQKQYSKHFYVHSLMNKQEAPKSYDILANQRTEEEFGYVADANNPTVGAVSATSNYASPVQHNKPLRIKKYRKSESALAKTGIVTKESSAPVTTTKTEPEKIAVPKAKPVKVASKKTVTKPKATVAKARYVEPREPINTKEYLVNWIKKIYAVEIDADNHSAEEIADIYTRLMWCSSLQNELNEDCHYINTTSSELRARYEMAKEL